jgi:predicted negative regulator of RcsB-dependent stress response
MGGVKQALAHHADEVRQQLPPAQQPQLRQVLVQLVRPGEGTEDTRQVATRQQIGETNWLLVKQLADKRLVVTGFDEETQQETVEVVHKALIRHWQPLREWLTQDRSFRLWQNDLRHNLASWERTGKKDEGALLRGARLAEAQDKQARQTELSLLEQAYIQASVALRAQEINRRKQLQQRIIGGLVSFLIIVLLLAGVAGWQWWQAEQRTTEVLLNQSYALAALAKIEIDKGDTTTGILLALEALPKVIAQPDRPYVNQAMKQLTRGIINWREQFIFQYENCGNFDDITDEVMIAEAMKPISRVHHVDFSHDGQRLIIEYDNCTKLWAVSNGQLLQTFQGDDIHAAFSPDGQQIVTISDDHTAKLWSVSNGQLLHTFQGHDGLVTHAAFSPDGQQLVTASDDNTAKLWDINLQHWIDFARQTVPRRLSTQQRQQFFLPPLPEQILSDQLVAEGEQLAQQGKVAEAIAKFTEAKAKDADLKLDPVTKVRISAIPQLLVDGRQLAEEGNIPAATIKFQQATKLGFQFGLNPVEKAQQITAMTKGTKLAEQGDIQAAVVQFQQAVKFGMQIDPEMKAKSIAAEALRNQSYQWIFGRVNHGLPPIDGVDDINI